MLEQEIKKKYERVEVEEFLHIRSLNLLVPFSEYFGDGSGIFLPLVRWIGGG